jgi:hypothetical protein
VIDDPANGGSLPGSWAKALPYCQNITITEYPGDTHPFPLRAETDGAALPQTAAPDFHETPDPLLSSLDHPGGTEAQSASLVAAARGYPVPQYCAVKVGNGAFHGERNA